MLANFDYSFLSFFLFILFILCLIFLVFYNKCLEYLLAFNVFDNSVQDKIIIFVLYLVSVNKI
jgi:hypothetical protein